MPDVAFTLSQNLQTNFPGRAGLVNVMDSINFRVDEDELLILVGEISHRLRRIWGEYREAVTI
ncbi:MAG: hypothetical protein QOC99_111 [Acidobacteriota bacterium]|jgi:hypothetical protein|nr:hypothetical protein [Acidobacteriota bacterium]MDT7777599.1 hypothetical protein [Acidobacteriota bacterium]